MKSDPDSKRSRDHWLVFGNHCVCVEESGPSRTTAHLMFFHGRFDGGIAWSQVLETLCSSYRCLSVSLPQLGRSLCAPARLLVPRPGLLVQIELIRHLVERFVPAGDPLILVGHDLGGALSLAYASGEGRGPTGMVLINPLSLDHGGESLWPGDHGFRSQWQLHGLLRALKESQPAPASEIRNQWRGRQARHARMQALRELSTGWPGLKLARDLRRGVARKGLPLLVLWGNRDPLNPLEESREILRDIPDAEIHQTSAGHWPCLEVPAWIAEKIHSFVWRITPAQLAWA